MATTGDHEQISFVTLGMFIIDDIYPPKSASDQTPQKDIIGGAGTYSAVGARIFSPPPSSQSVGWIVDAGTDFPPELRTLISDWDTGVLLRERDALTTRGWNGYGEHDHRAFKYLTPKLRLTADDLTPALLSSKSFHLICSPLRCIELTKRILDRRREAFGPELQRPLIIWEPVPDLCIPAEFDNAIEALKWVDVVSPNHEELLDLFSMELPHEPVGWIQDVKACADKLLDYGVGHEGAGAVVVRCGKHGAYFTCDKAADFPPRKSILNGASRNLSRSAALIPAYHREGSRVVDPTGGGNGFLGGFAIGLIRNPGNIAEAVMCGNIAASFCIEQVGVPKLSQSPMKDHEGEKWNGCGAFDRLEEYRMRCLADTGQ